MEEYTLDSRLLTLLSQPCRMDEIRRALPDAGKHEIKDALDRLTQAGKIMKNKKNRFAVSSHYGCTTGTFLATERGFAFVAPDVEEGAPKPDDLFIPPNAGGGAWHGDKVLVKVSERKNNRGRREATVIRIISRAGKELTGELVQRGKAFFVQPSSKKYPEIAVDRRDIGEAQPGDCVAVAVTNYGDDAYRPQGIVSAALGENGTMEASIAAVLHENGVYDVFPDEVLRQADSIPQEVDLASAGKRLDLRDKLIFTIDGDDAKDFDDAVSLEPLENGHYLLGVHIGRQPLRDARFPARRRGVPPRHLGLLPRSCRAHAAVRAVERHLLAQPERRPSGVLCPHGGGQERPPLRREVREIHHPLQGTHDLQQGQQNPCRRQGSARRIRLSRRNGGKDERPRPRTLQAPHRARCA